MDPGKEQCVLGVWWWGEDGGVLPGYFARVYIRHMSVDESGAVEVKEEQPEALVEFWESN